MHVITGSFATPHGSKYLQQLCKHFGHKREVKFNESEGRCAFEIGTAYFNADDGGLTVRFELDGQDRTERARSVIDKHLQRFAFREGFEGMDWSH